MPRWPLSRSPSRRAGARAGDDRDLVERVLAVEPVGQRGAPDRPLVCAAHLVLAEGTVHQQADQLRVGQERAAVGVVGGQHHLPGIAAQQEQLEPDSPLQGVDVVAGPVGVGHDPAPGLDLGVVVDPLAAVEVAEHHDTWASAVVATTTFW